jgi:sulfur carrier protein
MQLYVNGEARDVPAGSSLADLVVALGLAPSRVAIEHNRKLVPRAAFAQAFLAEGDKLEIVTLVGGG